MHTQITINNNYLPKSKKDFSSQYNATSQWKSTYAAIFNIQSCVCDNTLINSLTNVTTFSYTWCFMTISTTQFWYLYQNNTTKQNQTCQPLTRRQQWQEEKLDISVEQDHQQLKMIMTMNQKKMLSQTTSIKQKFIETKVASFSFVSGRDCLIGL